MESTNDRDDFDGDYEKLQGEFREYLKKVYDVKAVQKSCLQDVKRLGLSARQLKQQIEGILSKTDSDSEMEQLRGRLDALTNKEKEIRNMAGMLPTTNGIYLKIVLGEVNVSLLNKDDKFAYKNDYENFKFFATAVGSILTFIAYFITRNRFLDAICLIFLSWFYFTLTIRESILIANGSRIKGWWRTQHFITLLSVGLLLIWPISESYDQFRDQFMLFSLYINFVQCLQYSYQRNCLYKLRSLGARHSMDITVEGVMSWMNRQLFYLIPFNMLAYFSQLYNSIVLYFISKQAYCHEWHAFSLSVVYLILFIGNSLTTVLVLKQKIKSSQSLQYLEQLREKYGFLAGHSKESSKSF